MSISLARKSLNNGKKAKPKDSSLLNGDLVRASEIAGPSANIHRETVGAIETPITT